IHSGRTEATPQGLRNPGAASRSYFSVHRREIRPLRIRIPALVQRHAQTDVSGSEKGAWVAYAHQMQTQGQSVGVRSEVPSSVEAPRSLGNRLLLDAGGLLALRVTFGGLSFFLTILLARTLGTQGFGAYSYAYAWTVLLSVPAILGMDQLLIREIAAYRLQ